MIRKSTVTTTLLAATTLTLGAGSAYAAPVLVHHYALGEAGSLSANAQPQDSVGGAHFNGFIGFVPNRFSAQTASPSPVSSTYVGDGRAFGANFSGLATNNFGVEIWVRTSNLTQNADVLQINGTNSGSLKIGFLNGGWASSYHGLSWIGDNPFNNGNSQTPTANEWTHLAVIRDGGVSTFYIDGVAQAGTTNSTPVHGAGSQLSVNSGGSPSFTGDLDELRIFTFGEQDNPVEFLNLTAVPEPASGAMALVGLGAMAMRRRRG